MQNDMSLKNYYPPVDSNPNFVELEESIISTWRKNNIFQQSIKGDEEFIFYDGPPFANGLPHYGHLLTGFIKDIFARYQIICGKKVDRRFGWDCHGLPAEMGAEKDLGISGKKAIEEFGIDKFNNYCRTSVLKYTKEWQDYINRQARWVDFDNDYKTMDLSYMESVIWAFKTLYDKGLVYQSMRVMPYSWACETPVSDFETRIDNSYREKQSKAITVTFQLVDTLSSIVAEYSDVRVIAWTTTPWTLPSNLALAVGRDIEYACVYQNNICYIIAHLLLPNYEAEIGSNVVKLFKGEQLLGLKYKPLFPYFKDHANAFTILEADFVTTDDGTGIVHISPGFGEDDQKLCNMHNIELVCPVDSAGKFIYPVVDYIGKQVFEANDDIIIALKKQGLWLKTEQYLHNYPHCWRTDTPLIYKALSSWYVKVTAIKEQMIANNQKINWIPGHIKNGLFGKWLENARDWSISRNRYWGCPIPIWQSDDPLYPHTEVYGSIEELEQSFNVKIQDLHRPFIDTLVKPNPSDPTGRSMLRRIPEVFDCWFESGSMPYAQIHYPFENKEWFENHSTADFIVEYVAQTKGWFYTLTVLSTALFGLPPFLNCICHGVITGDDGQKLSKRLQNYTDPNLVFSTLGSDAMRWFMVSSSVMRGQELRIANAITTIKEAMRLAIKPIWNAYNFFTLYANADGIVAELDLSSYNILDKYIIAKSMQALHTIKISMDMYDTVSATKVIEEFFEALNNWYIRRSRERFWRIEKDLDKLQAYNTLYSVLNMLSRAISPLMPIITEAIYSGLQGNVAEKVSVHLETFPLIDKSLIDYSLISDMERVRDACKAALHIRNDLGIRVRQPLAKVTFIGVAQHDLSEELKQLILDEINVKVWENLDKSTLSKYAHYKLQINLPIIGKRMPQKVKEIIIANKLGNWSFANNQVTIADVILEQEEFELKLEAKPEYVNSIYPLSTNDGLVFLDTNISDALYQEGIARDIVRLIQQTRKEAGLDITDKIVVAIHIPDQDKIINAIMAWQDYIKEQTLSISITNKLVEDPLFANRCNSDDFEVVLQITQVIK